MAFQLVGELCGDDFSAEAFFNKFEEVLVLGLDLFRLLFLFLGLDAQVVVVYRAEFLVFKLSQRADDEFIYILRQVEDIVAFLAHALYLGQLVQFLGALAAGVVNVFLILRHIFNVFGDGDELSGLLE